MPPDARQLRRAGQDGRPSCARRWPPACSSSWSPRPSSAACDAAGDAARPAPRVAVRVNPDFEVKGSGMRMGGGPQQFGVDAERVPALLEATGRRPVSTCTASTSSPARRTCAPRCSARPSARPSSWCCELADARAGAGALPQPRRRLRHPVLRPATSRSTWPRSATTWQHSLDDRIASALARRARGDRARPLPRGRGRRLRDPGRRPQGVARPYLPGGRRRPAPPARGVGQLRPGDPAELSDRGRQPVRRAADRDGDRGRVPVHAARPARRQGHAAAGRDGRSGRGVPGRRLRPDRLAERLSEPSPRSRCWSETQIRRSAIARSRSMPGSGGSESRS